MGARGPSPKPTKIKILEGNPGKRPINQREPQPSTERPTCPHWLDLEAKREWRRIVPELDAMGILGKIDRAALAGYCQNWSEWRTAVEYLRANGRTYTTASGQVKHRPEVLDANKAQAKMKAFLTEFGLTPASRSRIRRIWVFSWMPSPVLLCEIVS